MDSALIVSRLQPVRTWPEVCPLCVSTTAATVNAGSSGPIMATTSARSHVTRPPSVIMFRGTELYCPHLGATSADRTHAQSDHQATTCWRGGPSEDRRGVADGVREEPPQGCYDCGRRPWSTRRPDDGHIGACGDGPERDKMIERQRPTGTDLPTIHVGDGVGAERVDDGVAEQRVASARLFPHREDAFRTSPQPLRQDCDARMSRSHAERRDTGCHYVRHICRRDQSHQAAIRQGPGRAVELRHERATGCRSEASASASVRAASSAERTSWR